MLSPDFVGVSGLYLPVDRAVLTPQSLHAIEQSGQQFEPAGCLSVPGAYDKVERALNVKMRGMDLAGNTFEIDADGLLAHCIQHEIDHLNGILFIDRLSRLKFERIKKKIEKNSRLSD